MKARSWSLQSWMRLQVLCDILNYIASFKDKTLLNSGSLVLYRYALVNPHRLCPLRCYAVARILENNPQLKEDIQGGKLLYQPAPKHWRVLCSVNKPFTQIRSNGITCGSTCPQCNVYWIIFCLQSAVRIFLCQEKPHHQSRILR